MPEDTGAGVSYATTERLACSACGCAFSFDVWLIVDAVDRPDLLERIRGGTLHVSACPKCGTGIGQADAPLLLYRPDAEPAILFSAAQQTSRQQDQEYAAGLAGRLRESLGAAWQDDWLAQGLRSVPREMLPAMLSGNPEAAAREMAAGLQAEMERLAAEDPGAFRQLMEAAQQAAQASEGDDESDEDGSGEDEDSAELPSENVNLSAVSLATSDCCGNILASRRNDHDPSPANRREQV